MWSTQTENDIGLPSEWHNRVQWHSSDIEAVCGNSGNVIKRNVVQPSQIEKGAGLPADGVMVCGDSGNDIELFAVPGVRGCMVVNAHPELRKYCEQHASPNIFQVGVRALLL